MQEVVRLVILLNNSPRNNLGLSCLHHHYVRLLLLLDCKGGGGGGVNDLVTPQDDLVMQFVISVQV